MSRAPTTATRSVAGSSTAICRPTSRTRARRSRSSTSAGGSPQRWRPTRSSIPRECDSEHERNAMSEEEIVLSELPDEELVKQMHDDLYDGLAEEIHEGTQILLDREWSAEKGDIHDIGKNLVAMMLEGAGFEVVDLGINNPVEDYLAALEEHKPDILGMSALLTTTMPYMKVVIEELSAKGLRDKYIVMVGGAPLNEEFGKAVGADAYCRDAAVAAETAQALVLARRAAVAAS